ncbi:ATP synthase mitochondrial F1 complex assembly factor 1 isoform X2 [Arctopsyche grandis]|uniref:ATP synthase mitochondrial F1 complex assembly factor 1 isoform X2 n=1 Tax=Arctopsyche grandis TaxID=121162 RepID=UPI00406D9212
MALILNTRVYLLSKLPILYRSIMSSSHNLQKVMEDLQTNPYYKKYADKIATLQKVSPDEFMQRIEQTEKAQPVPDLKAAERRYAPVLNPKAPQKESSLSTTRKRLDDIFKIELVHEKDKDEIVEIWHKYHIQKDVIAAVIPADNYKQMEERIAKYPTFLFPLPRSQGYEFIMCQAADNTVHFTTLLCFQIHKENAPECLTVTHYKELMDEKGIVLMRGEYDKNVLDGKEAQCLANQFQMYYGQDFPSKLRLLHDFTNNPDRFKHMDLVAELEDIKIT